MTFAKILCAATLAVTLGATSVAAGGAPPPPAASSNNTGRDVLIGAAVIGLVIWALGGFSAGAGAGGAVSTQGGTSDGKSGPSKGKVLGRY